MELLKVLQVDFQEACPVEYQEVGLVECQEVWPMECKMTHQLEVQQLKKEIYSNRMVKLFEGIK